MGIEGNFEIIKIFTLTTVSFIVAISWTPLLTHFLYKHKLGKQIRPAEETPVFSRMHEPKSGTPTMGGILIWLTTLFIILVFYVLSEIINVDFIQRLNFFSRAETLLPLGALIASALVGLIDDIFNIKRIGTKGGGLKIRYKLIIYSLIAIVGAYWFYFKLDWTTLHIPLVGNTDIGFWYIPFFIFIIVATSFSVNESDGLDGLAGGILMISFGAFGAIAFAQGKFELAAFCGVIIGAMLAFLWFNINPARFFMGDTGSMSLGVTLGIVAMLTNSALLLPIIGILLVLESGSVIIQTISKKLFKRKFFLSAPLHHHLEAKGWSEPKIVMRSWVITGVAAAIGLIIYLIDK